MRCGHWILTALVFSFLIQIAASPVDVLKISDGETDIYARPFPIGGRFVLTYIHSVEKTRVEDDYRLVSERIWSWEERVVSHNAGMPFLKPRNGRLIMDGDWLRFRGGRYSWGVLYYRVGNDLLGMNELFVFPPQSDHRMLFRILPSERLRLSVSKSPLIISLLNSRNF